MFLSAICPDTDPTFNAAKYPKLSWSGRWIDWSDTNNPHLHHTNFNVPFYLHANINAENAAFVNAVGDAAYKWTNISNNGFSYFKIQWYSSSNTWITTNIASSNYLNEIAFDYQGKYFDNPPPTGPFTPKETNSQEYLAFTQIVWADNPRLCVNLGPWWKPRILEADIYINPFDIGWEIITKKETDNLKFDFTYMMTHEFGHVAGLNHITDEKAVMFAKQTNGTPAIPLDGDTDILAIKLLYGGCDQVSIDQQTGEVTQIPYINCSDFKDESRFLVQAVLPCDEDDDCCGSGCRTGLPVAQISERAYENIVVFGIYNCHKNINRLRREIVNDKELLIEITDTTNTEYAETHAIMRNARDINAALLDATFRCPLNVIEKDLVLEEENIQSLVILIDEFLTYNLNEELQFELLKLKNALPNFIGLNIKEAAIYYDQGNFEN
ncbi:MAG: matrixin family metalloprotease [Bacteroidia bacterium]